MWKVEDLILQQNKNSVILNARMNANQADDNCEEIQRQF